jgi:ferredoxin
LPRVRFEEEGEPPVEFEVGFDSNLHRAAVARSLSLFNGPMKLLNCWGKGYCGACFVEVVRGAASLPERTAVERKKLKDTPLSIRLACQVPVKGDLVIRKPDGVLRPRLKRGRTHAHAAASPGGGVPAAAVPGGDNPVAVTPGGNAS